jgi:type I restriction enzyme, S subunit
MEVKIILQQLDNNLEGLGMKNWFSKELGKTASIFNGSTPSTNNEDYWNGDIIWITPKDLSDQNQKYILKGERTITQKALSNTKLLPKGTVLLSSRAPIGLLSIALSDLVTNQGFKNIVVNAEILHNEYLYYYLKLKKNELNKLGSGTTFKELSKSTLEKYKIKFPDLPTQKSIAKVLSDLDAKIELNNKINRELEAMAKTLYDYWFVQFDFPNEQGKPYKSSGGKMVFNAELKREIPKGWEVKRLAEIANITMGQSPEGSSYNDDGIGEIFFQGSTDFGWRYPTIRQYTSQPSRRAKAGDILLSVRAPVGTLNIADNDCCIGRGLAALNSKSGYDSYLYYVMEYFKQIFDNRNNAGTTFGSITKDDLYSLKLVYPKNDLLKNCNQTVSKYNQMILNNHKQNQQLTDLRDWLLPMLMNGQVTVRQALKSIEFDTDGIWDVAAAAETQAEYPKKD